MKIKKYFIKIKIIFHKIKNNISQNKKYFMKIKNIYENKK
jgi:hypothetical protein